MKAIQINGAIGGGQILRSALTLSLLTGQAFRLNNIRAQRPKPGLQRQHLVCVQAAAAIADAATDGAELGSREIVFRPGQVRAGEYHWAIGSAGSTTLVLQTVLLPLLLRAAGPSRVTIEGGTHNPLAPTFDFVERVFLPALHSLGMPATVVLAKPGFFPAGGGKLLAEMAPATPLVAMNLRERPPLQAVRATALCAHVPVAVGEREIAAARQIVNHPFSEAVVREVPESDGPGNVFMLEADFGQLREIVASFGDRSRNAEAVGTQAAKGLATFLASSAPVGVHLADQLLIPLAIAGGAFCTLPLSDHSKSNLEVIAAFLGTKPTVQQGERGLVEVSAPGSLPVDSP